MQYLLDTSICIFFLRGQLQLDEVFLEKEIKNCFISEVTVFELKYGAENSQNPSKSHLAVSNFINLFSIVPIRGLEDAYAKVKVQLRKNGTPMHDEFDLIIGVTAMVHGLVLVTHNVKDFQGLPNLEIQNWLDSSN